MAESSGAARRAVVVAGGYLSSPASYTRLAARLRQPPYSRHVEQVQLGTLVWLGIRDSDFRPVADAIAAAVERARQASAGAPVTIVGHSAGGFASRIYLGDTPYNGSRYNGQRFVDRLITLGSPHNSNERFTRRVTSWVNNAYPGAYCPGVRYVTVAGKALLGDRRGSLRQRLAHFQYRSQSGNGDEWGDGVVPVAIAHLDGALKLTLTGVQHVPNRPHAYDAPEAVAVWAEHLEDEG